MRIIVTGGRDYTDRELVFRTLDLIDAEGLGISHLAHGACPTGSESKPYGADWLADAWGRENGLEVGKTLLRYPADFRRFGKYAGPDRNARMIDDFKPDLVIAFPGGKGTKSCTEIAMRRGVQVRKIEG